MGERRISFLEMPVEARNEVTDLFTHIKSELRKYSTLGEMGFKSTWENIGLNEFLRFDQEHYFHVIENSRKRKILKQRLIIDIAKLFKVMGSSTDTPYKTLNGWLTERNTNRKTKHHVRQKRGVKRSNR